MKYLVVLALALFAASVMARDITTLSGKTYKDVQINNVTPLGFDMSYTPEGGGIAIKEMFFKDMPENIKKEFHYNPKRAEAYQKRVNAYLEARQKAQYKAYRERIRKEQLQQEAEDRFSALVYSHRQNVTLKILECLSDGITAWASLPFASDTTGQLGKVFVMGLQIPNGGEWSGYIYPLGLELNGYSAYTTSLDSAVEYISNNLGEYKKEVQEGSQGQNQNKNQ